ncbi:MAG: DUF1810 domain-containing protein [Caulobacteraceae bacterium]|nr:MAG: DUF1810 domain-containing protein [Caulobacteraceae bacterium]
MAAPDPYNLWRFTSAQAGVFNDAMAELRAGRKRSHWMWFVFPQLRALGRSSTAQFYGLASLAEARAYLDHVELGPRLIESVNTVLGAPSHSLSDLFGAPDDLKFRSCMTLFDAVRPDEVFQRALDEWCDGERDGMTLSLIEPNDQRSSP